MANLLEIRNLSVEFRSENKWLRAVDNVSLNLEKGKTLGIVGESGCGKSVTSLAVMRLIQSPGRIAKGEIVFNGLNLLEIDEEAIRKIRGNKIAMIFQEPMTSLNPVYTCGEQIEEVIRLHQPNLSKSQMREKSIDMLKLVGIPAPEKRFFEYPHQLSGGMRQRIMIAMAMTCQPELLIADEPTTALDVTIQAQILDLMRSLKTNFGTSMILITHDLGVVAETCDEVAVMYAGQIIEQGPVDQLFAHPQHPYTQGLLKSIPHFDSSDRQKRLQTIPGMVPSLANLPKGCRFMDRCEYKQPKCEGSQPVLTEPNPNLQQTQVACYYPLQSKGS